MWYEDRQEWIAAGQPRTSKIYKRLHLHPQVGVLDLVAVTYPTWQAEHFSLPEARLWTLKPEPSPVSRRRITR